MSSPTCHPIVPPPPLGVVTKASIDPPLGAARATLASPARGYGGGGVCTSHFPANVTPVSGSVVGALVTPPSTVKVPLCVTRTSLLPPIVIAYSPSRQVEEARIRLFVWFTHTSVPSVDASCRTLSPTICVPHRGSDFKRARGSGLCRLPRGVVIWRALHKVCVGVAVGNRGGGSLQGERPWI